MILCVQRAMLRTNSPAMLRAFHMTTVFLSYGRGDDEPFVERLCQALKARGLDVWYDRESLSSRGRTFHQEIRDAIAARDRLVLVVGPHAVSSEYVRQEWQFALEADKVVTPILRIGDYPLVPDELKLLQPSSLPGTTAGHGVSSECFPTRRSCGRLSAWLRFSRSRSWCDTDGALISVTTCRLAFISLGCRVE